MIKNFKKIFAIILVFILSSFYIFNINTFADEISEYPLPFDMDGFDFESTEETDSYTTSLKAQIPIILSPFNISPESCSSGESSDGDFVSSSYINPELKVQLDNVFGKLQEIHPEITVYAVNADDYKTKLALLCTYLQDLSRSNIPCQNQCFSRQYRSLCDQAKNNMKALINSAVFELYEIDLSAIHLESDYYSYDGFDFLYSISGMDSFEKTLDNGIQNILSKYNLCQIFESIKIF